MATTRPTSNARNNTTGPRGQLIITMVWAITNRVSAFYMSIHPI